MPPVVWDQATWEATYRVRVRDPLDPQHGQILVGASRKLFARILGPTTDTLDVFVQRWSNLVRDFGITPSQRVLVAGCGLGYLIEAAHDAGYPLVWGIDSSTYIAGKRPIESRGDVLWVEADINGGGQVRAALRQLTGDDRFTWVISEDVLTSYEVTGTPPAPSTAMTQMLNAADSALEAGRPASAVIHMVTEAPLPTPAGMTGTFTSLTLEEWNALRPACSWVSIRLGQWRVL